MSCLNVPEFCASRSPKSSEVQIVLNCSTKEISFGCFDKNYVSLNTHPCRILPGQWQFALCLPGDNRGGSRTLQRLSANPKGGNQHIIWPKFPKTLHKNEGEGCLRFDCLDPSLNRYQRSLTEIQNMVLPSTRFCCVPSLSFWWLDIAFLSYSRFRSVGRTGTWLLNNPGPLKGSPSLPTRKNKKEW